MKDTDPVKLDDYALAQCIQDKLEFVWWFPYVKKDKEDHHSKFEVEVLAT